MTADELYARLCIPGTRFRVSQAFTVRHDDELSEVFDAGDYETEYADIDGDSLFWSLIGGRRKHAWDPNSGDVFLAVEAGVIQVLT